MCMQRKLLTPHKNVAAPDDNPPQILGFSPQIHFSFPASPPPFARGYSF